VSGARGRQPDLGKFRIGRGHVEQHSARAIREIVALCILSRKCFEGGLNFDQRHLHTCDAPRERQPCRAHSGAEVNGMLTSACVCRGRKQDRVMADPMAAARLAQDQPPT